jgi:adenosine deaminase
MRAPLSPTRRSAWGPWRILAAASLALLARTAPAAAVADPAVADDPGLRAFISAVPKAELHVHLEGTIDPEEYLRLAARNGLPTPFPSAEAVRQRLRHATDLNTFIEVFVDMQAVIRTEADIHDIAVTYFTRARAEGIVYIEMFFDPQTHLERGLTLATIFAGLEAARTEAARTLGLHVEYIMCFNRNRSAESAMAVLEASQPWRGRYIGIGLDNPEETNFPAKFAAVYARARALGLHLTSHCDVDQPNSRAHIRGCLETLRVERIDHGVNVLDDPGLVAAVRDRHIGLTVCPTLLYTTIPGRMEKRGAAIRRMLELGLLATVNSDDPGIMRGLLPGDLLWKLHQSVGLTRGEVAQLARNSFQVAWLGEPERAADLAAVQEAVDRQP